MKIEELKSKIEEIKKEIETFELDPDEYENEFWDLLDAEGTIDVAGIGFYPSRILMELDPIAYRCSLIDYVGCMDVEDCKEYRDLVEELEQLESELEDLEGEED
jgi:hypothetical protein